MEQEKLVAFNEELNALLKKFNCQLGIEEKIVVQNVPEKLSETTASGVVPETSGTTATE